MATKQRAAEGTGDEEFVIRETVSTSSLGNKLLTRRRKSKYEDLVRRCAALSQGQSLVLALPQVSSEREAEMARNNISAAIKRKVAQAGAKGKMRFAVAQEGKSYQLVISCTPN